jgi:signal transduction histidine kinase
MSDIVWSINPQNDSLEQVTAKMKEFAAEILEPKEISYTFTVDETILSTKLDVERRKNIFLIFKEAVNNAAKYSEAASVEIRLNRENGSLKLSVVDNGKGFDAATIAQGNGLKNMTDRAQGMKGHLTQHSTIGKGSSILLEVPLT